MDKYAWTMHIKPECIDEYVNMHMNPWPGITEKHKEAGFKNLSVFQNGCQCFYIFECEPENVSKAFAFMENDPICKKWTSVTSKMVEGSFDFSEDEPIKFMREIFKY